MHALFTLRRRSLPRAALLVLLGLALATALSHFPYLAPNPWIALPLLAVVCGTAETVRCMQRRWSYYHAGVILCLYMDLMAVTLVLFFLLYPYFTGFSVTR